jgi:hypothetical protein
MAGGRLPGAAEQKLRIFSLPGFVEDLLIAGQSAALLPLCARPFYG